MNKAKGEITFYEDGQPTFKIDYTEQEDQNGAKRANLYRRKAHGDWMLIEMHYFSTHAGKVVAMNSLVNSMNFYINLSEQSSS